MSGVRAEDVDFLLPSPKDPFGLMWYMFEGTHPRKMYLNWTAEEIAARIINRTEQRKRRISHDTGAE